MVFLKFLSRKSQYFMLMRIVFLANLSTFPVHAGSLACTDFFLRGVSQKVLAPGEVSGVLKNAGLQARVDRRILASQFIFLKLFIKSPKNALLKLSLAKQIKAFETRWKIPIYYSNDPSTQNVFLRAPSEVSATAEALFIPIAFFLAPQRIVILLSRIDRLLNHRDRLQRLGANTHLDISSLTLTLKGSQQGGISDPFVQWIVHRGDRHQISFEIRENDPTLIDAAGYAENRLIVLRGEYISDSPDRWLNPDGQSILAHEITHATNDAKFNKYGSSAEKLIYFRAVTEHAIHPLSAYEQLWASDEYDASLIEARWSRYSDRILRRSKTFLIQKEWLSEALRVLKSESIGYLAGDRWGQSYFFVEITYRGQVIEMLIPYNDLSLKRQNAWLNDTVERDYIVDILQKRLTQLENLSGIRGLE